VQLAQGWGMEGLAFMEIFYDFMKTLGAIRKVLWLTSMAVMVTSWAVYIYQAWTHGNFETFIIAGLTMLSAFVINVTVAISALWRDGNTN